MAKDIMELSSEEDLKEFLEEQRDHITEAKKLIKNDIKDVYADTVFAITSLNDMKDLDHQALFYYIQAIQILATDINLATEYSLRTLIMNIEYKLYDIPNALRSTTIIRDWKILQDHFEKNPSIKEEWDALLMAIKLTEDD